MQPFRESSGRFRKTPARESNRESDPGIPLEPLTPTDGSGQGNPPAPPTDGSGQGNPPAPPTDGTEQGNPPAPPNDGTGQGNPPAPPNDEPDEETPPATAKHPMKGFQCFSQWWFLLVLFTTSTTFNYAQPMWHEYNGGFVQRDYNLTGVSNETQLSQDDVNKFVKILHTIIVNEGCYENLDPYNMAVEFFEDRPIIPRDIIFDDFRRIENYTYEEASLVIESCTSLFNMSSQGVVMPYGNGFIYTNDSLLKFCGYHVFGYLGDTVLFVLLFCFYGGLHLFSKCYVNNYCKNKNLLIFCGVDREKAGCCLCCANSNAAR